MCRWLNNINKRKWQESHSCIVILFKSYLATERGGRRRLWSTEIQFCRIKYAINKWRCINLIYYVLLYLHQVGAQWVFNNIVSLPCLLACSTTNIQVLCNGKYYFIPLHLTLDWTWLVTTGSCLYSNVDPMHRFLPLEIIISITPGRYNSAYRP